MVDGVRLHVRDEGRGPALLLLNGHLGSLHMWDPWIPELTRHFRVIRLDYPPYGLSGPDPRGVYSTERAVQLVGKHVDSTVNNPIEAVAQWKGGALRPLCLFDAKRSVYTEKVTATMAWSDIPTCKESGVNTEYQMLRGIFMSPGVTKPQVDFYVNLMTKVMQTPDWIRFMEEGAFNQTVKTGAEFTKWVEAAEKTHYDLMKEADFLAK